MFRFGTKYPKSVVCARCMAQEIVWDSCWILVARSSMAVRNTALRGDSGQAWTTSRRYRRNAISSFILAVYKHAARQCSDPHIPRVQTPRHPNIRGALDNRPAVREYSHLVRMREEAQRELIGSYFAQRRQHRTKPPQIQGARALVDLHGVAPAQTGRRAPLTFQVD